MFNVAAGRSLELFYGQVLPKSAGEPIMLLLVYIASLLVSGLVLFLALRTLGGSKGGLVQDYPKAVFTSLIRDLIMGPLIILIAFYPLAGIAVGFIAWFGLVKYTFQVSWVTAFLSWLVSALIYLVLILFIFIPLALMFL